MLFLIFVMNAFGLLVLWRHFRLLKGRYYDVAAELETSKRLRFKAEGEAELWRQNYNTLSDAFKRMRQVGFEPDYRGRRA